jgi:protein-disulfide isomerase
MLERKRKVLMGALSGAGLLFAVLASLAEAVPWLHALCSGLGDGCRETATYTLLGVPLWIYGVVFYVFLGLAAFAASFSASLDWLVAGLLGVEATLVILMASEKLLCVYCIGNLLVVLALFAVTFRGEIFWRTLALGLMTFLVSFHLIVRPASPDAVAAQKPESPKVAARVGDAEIGMAELEAPLTTQIYDLEREKHRLKREKLDDLIVEMLLQKEAGARNISVQELINVEVISKGITVSDDEIDQYYAQNRAKLAEWKGSLDELKSRIRTSLQQQNSVRKTIEYAWTLKTKYPVVDYLEEPASPFAVLETEGSPALGPQDAPVTVFEFSDYECPSCRQAHDVVREVKKHYGQQIRWVFKDYPLKRHEYARGAAEAARCAEDQGKFWAYQDLLYGSSADLTKDRLLRLAADLGLDMVLFKGCVEGGKHQASVERDLEQAKKAGLDRTPSFVINGRLITGSQPFDRFVQVIDEELKAPRKNP